MIKNMNKEDARVREDDDDETHARAMQSSSFAGDEQLKKNCKGEDCISIS